MAWNRPRENGEAVSRPLQKRKGFRFPIRGAIAGAIVVIGAAVAAWWLWPSDGSAGETPPPRSARQIKEVAPAAAPTNAVRKAKREWPPEWHVPDDWDKPYPPQAYWPDGTLKQHSRYVRVVTNVRHHVSIQERTFKNYADRRIAGLLIRRPGEVLIGEMPFGEDFVEEFKESLKEEIKIEEGDLPYTRSLKQAVIDARAELKRRMDAGEDIAKVMTETRKELKELGLYREELRKQVDRIREEHGDTFTEKDEQDLIDAANKMLEERGCKPLTAPKIFVKQMEVMK